jgi:hypothetical protein
MDPVPVTSTAETRPSVEAAAPPPEPGHDRRRGRRWRLLLAALVIVPSFLGQIIGTDDAWPFAPFRMFAAPTRRTTAIVVPQFRAVRADGREVHLYADDFGVRRAEVEPNLLPGYHLPARLLADLATTYNGEHPDRRLVRLELHRVGQRLVDGRPGAKVDQVVQVWEAP